MYRSSVQVLIIALNKHQLLKALIFQTALSGLYNFPAVLKKRSTSADKDSTSYTSLANLVK